MLEQKSGLGSKRKKKEIPTEAKKQKRSTTKVAHRESGLPTGAKIRVRSETLSAVNQYSKEYVMSADGVVWELIEFYRLQNLDLLIERLHAKYHSGLTLAERAQFAILYTMLGEIDRISGL